MRGIFSDFVIEKIIGAKFSNGLEINSSLLNPPPMTDEKTATQKEIELALFQLKWVERTLKKELEELNKPNETKNKGE